MSKSISESVKQVVSDTMNDRDRKMRDSTAAMFYGLPEKKQDARDVNCILQTLSVNCVPTGGVRLGREKANAQPRPLKVMFNSPADRDAVLRATRHLKDSKTFSGVRISRFLNKEELDNEKASRAQCKQLNEEAKAKNSGLSRNPFVVINGGLMERQPNGKLKPFKQDSNTPTERLSSSPSHPKNV
jgi:hypothetical protein